MPLRGVQSEEKTGASLNVPGGHVCRVHVAWESQIDAQTPRLVVWL